MGIYASWAIGCFALCHTFSRLLQEFLAGPVLVAVQHALVMLSWSCRSNDYLLAIGHVSPHDQGNLLFPHLLDRNLEGIRLTLKINKHRRIHAVPS